MAEQVSNLQGSLSVDVSQLDKAASVIERFGKAGIDAFRKLTKSQETIVASLAKLDKSIESLSQTLALFPKSMGGIVEASKKASAAVSGLSTTAGKQGLNIKKLGEEHKRLSDLVSKSGLSQKKQEDLIKSLDTKYNALSKSIEKTGASSDSTKKKEEGWLATIGRVTSALEKQTSVASKPVKSRDNSKQLLADVKALGLYSLEEAVAVKNTEKLTAAEKKLLEIQKSLRTEVAKGIEAIGGFKGPPEAAVEGFKRLQEASKKVGDALRAGNAKNAKEALTGLTRAIDANDKAFQLEIKTLEEKKKVEAEVAQAIQDVTDRTKQYIHQIQRSEKESAALSKTQKEFRESTQQAVKAIVELKGKSSGAIVSLKGLEMAQSEVADALRNGDVTKAKAAMESYRKTVKATITDLEKEAAAKKNLDKVLSEKLKPIKVEIDVVPPKRLPVVGASVSPPDDFSNVFERLAATQELSVKASQELNTTLASLNKTLADVPKHLKAISEASRKNVSGYNAASEAAFHQYSELKKLSEQTSKFKQAITSLPLEQQEALTKELDKSYSALRKSIESTGIASEQTQKDQKNWLDTAEKLRAVIAAQAAANKKLVAPADATQGSKKQIDSSKKLLDIQNKLDEATRKFNTTISGTAAPAKFAAEALATLLASRKKVIDALKTGDVSKATAEIHNFSEANKASVGILNDQAKAIKAAHKAAASGGGVGGTPSDGGDGGDDGEMKKEIDVSKKLLDIKQQLINQTKRLTDTINNFRGAEDFAVGATNKLSTALRRAEDALETGDIDKAVDELKLFRNATINITDELRQEIVMIGANEKAQEKLAAAEEEARKTAILHMNALKEMRKEQNALLGIEQQLAQKMKHVNDLVKGFKGPPELASQAFQNVAAAYNRLMEAMRSKDVDAARIAIKNLSAEVIGGAGVLNAYEKEMKEAVAAQNESRKAGVQVVQAEEEMRKEKQALVLIQKKLDTALQATNAIIANSKAPTEAASRLTHVLFVEYKKMLDVLATGKSKLADDTFKEFNENIKQAVQTLKAAEDDVKRTTQSKVATRKKEEEIGKEFVGADKAMKSQAKAAQDLVNIQKEAAHHFTTLNDAIVAYKGPADVATAETQKLFEAFKKFTQAINSGDVDAARGAIKSFALDVKGSFHVLQKEEAAIKAVDTANKKALNTQKALGAEMAGGRSRFEAYVAQQRNLESVSKRVARDTTKFITVINKLGVDSSTTADLMNRLAAESKKVTDAVAAGDFKVADRALQNFRVDMDRYIETVKQTATSTKAATDETKKADVAEAKRLKTINNLEIQFDKAVAAIQKGTASEKEQAAAIARLTEAFNTLKTALNGAKTSVVEITKAENAFRKSLSGVEIAKAAEATDAFRRGMQGITKSTQVALGPLSGVASRLSAVSALLTRGATSIGLVLLGFTALVVAVKQVTHAYVDYEKQLFRINAVLDATGKASVLTAQRVSLIATSFANNTGSSSALAKDAAATAIAFKSIDGSNLEQALTAAKGLELIFGGGLQDNMKKIGNLLSGSEDGLNALNEQGIRFTQIERQKIKLLVESFRAAEAQKLIFEKINPIIEAAKSEQKGFLAAVTASGNALKQIVVKVGAATHITSELEKSFREVQKALLDIANDTQSIEKASAGLKVIMDGVAEAVRFTIEHFKEILSVLAAIFALASGFVIVRLLLLAGRAALALVGQLKAVGAVVKNVGGMIPKWLGTGAAAEVGKATAATGLWKKALIGVLNVLSLIFAGKSFLAVNEALDVTESNKSLGEYNKALNKAKEIISTLPENIKTTYELQLKTVADTKGFTDRIVEQLQADRKVIGAEIEKIQKDIKKFQKTNIMVPAAAKELDGLKLQLARLELQYQATSGAIDAANKKYGETAQAATAVGEAANKAAEGVSDLSALEIERAAEAFNTLKTQLLPITTELKEGGRNAIILKSALAKMVDPAQAETAKKLAEAFGFDNVPEAIRATKTALASLGDVMSKANNAATTFVFTVNNELKKAADNFNRFMKSNGQLEFKAHLDLAEIEKEIRDMQFEEKIKVKADLGVKTDKDAARLILQRRELTADINKLQEIQVDFMNMSVIPGLRHQKNVQEEIALQYDKQITFLQEIANLVTAMPEVDLPVGFDRESFARMITELNNRVQQARIDALAVPTYITPPENFNLFVEEMQRRFELDPPTFRINMPDWVEAITNPMANAIKDGINKASEFFGGGKIFLNSLFGGDINAVMAAAFSKPFKITKGLIDPASIDAAALDASRRYHDALEASMEFMPNIGGIEDPFRDAQLELDMQFFAEKERITQEFFASDKEGWKIHMEQLFNDYQAASKVNSDMYKNTLQSNLSMTSEVFGNMAQVAAIGLGKEHTLYKRFAQAQVIISTSIAIMKALAEGGPTMGPILAASMAVLAGAQMAQIESAQFAKGGMVQGPGTPTSDSVPARLSKGEFVINAAATKAFGAANLQMINQKKMVPEAVQTFNKGGFVNNTVNNINSTVNKFGAQKSITKNELPSVTKMVDYSTMRPVMQEQQSQNIRIVNAYDTAVVGDYLGSADGEKIIMNVLSKNGTKVRNIASGNY